jgi:hypothetical protein
MVQGRTKLWYLKNIDLFRHLNDEGIRMIEQHTLMREIKKGEALYFEGGILKNHLLPACGKPAAPENILNQLRSPYQNMPSFSELPVSEVLNIIAFLNTL